MQLKPNIRKQYQNTTSNPAQNYGEVNDQPSMTIPDQALTPQEVFVRYAQGRSVDSRQPIYSSSYLPNIDKMDLVDLDNLAKANKLEINQLTEDYKQFVKKSNEERKKQFDEREAKQKAILDAFENFQKIK